MKTQYFLQATGLGSRLPDALEQFKRQFGGSSAIATEDIQLGARVVLEYDPDILATAQDWAKAFPFLEVRDHYVRLFTPDDCKKGDLCFLNFANCYLWPRPYKWGQCESCGGNIQVPTGEEPNHLELEYGIGQWEASLFLSPENADEILKSGLTGCSLTAWKLNSRYRELRPTLFLDEVLIEDVNAVGLGGTVCGSCGRPNIRFIVGPTHLNSSGYQGEDIVGSKFMGFQSLCFSQRAAAYLIDNFRAVSYSEPVILGNATRSSDNWRLDH